MMKCKVAQMKIVRKWQHVTGFTDDTDFCGMLANGDYIVVNNDGEADIYQSPFTTGFIKQALINQALKFVAQGKWEEIPVLGVSKWHTQEQRYR